MSTNQNSQPLKYQFKLLKSTPKKFIDKLQQLLKKFGQRQLFLNFSKVWALDYNDEQNDELFLQEVQVEHFYADILNWMDQWDIQCFQPRFLPWRTLQPFFKQLSATQFNNLKVMKLQSLRLTSIEPLQWMNCPKIQCITLDLNRITTLRSLGKSNFHNLSKVALFHNSLNGDSLKNLQRMRSKKFVEQDVDNTFQPNKFMKISLSVNFKQRKSQQMIQIEQVTSFRLIEHLFVKLPPQYCIGLQNYQKKILSTSPMKQISGEETEQQQQIQIRLQQQWQHAWDQRLWQ